MDQPKNDVQFTQVKSRKNKKKQNDNKVKSNRTHMSSSSRYSSSRREQTTNEILETRFSDICDVLNNMKDMCHNEMLPLLDINTLYIGSDFIELIKKTSPNKSKQRKDTPNLLEHDSDSYSE